MDLKKNKIIILNGSPKGEKSVTLQYCYFIQKNFPEINFTYFNIATEIVNIERNQNYFEDILDTIKSAEGIIWAFPVYKFMIPGQLKRFIELIFERKKEDCFEGKYCVSVVTSQKFYDSTAINYIHAISEDMKMKYIESFSAILHDILKKDIQKNLIYFFERFIRHIREEYSISQYYSPIKRKISNYIFPERDEVKKKDSKHKVVILTDAKYEDFSLLEMIRCFRYYYPSQTEVINLNSVNLKGGCLGCLKCANKGECVYQDDFNEIYYNKMGKSDVVIFAPKIVDRFFSSIWKLFYDREFSNGHKPGNMGKHIAYLVSGPLSQNHNIQIIIHGKSEIERVTNIGVVTDEQENTKEITLAIRGLALEMYSAVNNSYSIPRSFWGEGGHRVFRDLIYSMKGFLIADHKFYKKNKLYDYPQKKFGIRYLNRLFLILNTIFFANKGLIKNIPEKMLYPINRGLKLKD